MIVNHSIENQIRSNIHIFIKIVYENIRHESGKVKKDF